MNTIQEVVDFFTDHGYTWNFNGDHRVPTYTEVQETVDKAATALYGSAIGSKWEAGRLIVVKDHNSFFIYVLIGETK